jgi:hypothetical protein
MKRTGCILFIIAALTALRGQRAHAEEIVTEGSVWRCHTTWMKRVVATGDGFKEAREGRGTRGIRKETTSPPPEWRKPDFDDSSWEYWRRPFRSTTLKLKSGGKFPVWADDGEDTGIPLYTPGQYGHAGSPYIGLRCMRVRFQVDDPSGVRDLKFSAVFRGGIVAYLNGAEIGRSHLPPSGAITPSTPADQYPAEAYFDPRGLRRKLWRKRQIIAEVVVDPDVLKQYNARIRRFATDIPAGRPHKGVNVLAIEIHRAPSNAPGTDRPAAGWDACGLVSATLAGSGAVRPALGRPKGFRVWTADTTVRISPFGFMYMARVGQGAIYCFERFPLSWGDPYGPAPSVRMVGARNSVATAQIGLSCDTDMEGIQVATGDLSERGGAGRLPASAIRALYMTFPDEPVSSERSPSASYIDALQETPPEKVTVRPPGETRPWTDLASRKKASNGVTTWIDPGAAIAVWIRVRIPPDLPAGKYEGTCTVAARGHEPVRVPVHLRVADWVLPDPGDWEFHVGLPHSPDTLSIWYKEPLWSEKHWRLVEKTVARMGELGCKAVYLPLRANAAWFRNERSLVYRVKKPDGTVGHDYRIFDRYMDLVQKHMKPDMYCLYAVDFAGRKGGARADCSVLNPTDGTVHKEEGPEYTPTDEAVAFWKPVMQGVVERLKARGIRTEDIFLGLAWEGAGASPTVGKPKAELFKQVLPSGIRLAQLAHYGGAWTGPDPDIRYGYAMSVWGNKTRVKVKGFGAKNLPLRVIKHFRADPIIDLRPTAFRGSLRLCMEEALKDTQGIGPLGMDFWHLPAMPARGKRYPGTIEGGASPNLSMSGFSTPALLAPGPDGPVSTGRFEIFREGLQECVARMVIETALADKARVDAAVVKRCEEVLARRSDVMSILNVGGRASGEGWTWFGVSGWEDRACDLFTCAGEVSKAVASQ